MHTKEQIQKHIDRYKYYRLMKYKMQKKMICEFRTLEKITHNKAREIIKKGQIDGELVVGETRGLGVSESELAKGTDFCPPSCKPDKDVIEGYDDKNL
jgi:hypothetical protein